MRPHRDLPFLAAALAATSSLVLAQRAPDTRLDTTNPTIAGGSSRARVSVSGDKVYAVWQDDRTAGYLKEDIYFNRSTDGGETWLAADVRVCVGDPAGSAYSWQPEIASFGDHVFVVWQDGRDFPQSASIYFNRSLDGGTTWLTSSVRLDLGLGTLSSHPRICNAGDKVYVVWYEAAAPTSIQYARSASAGDPGTWSLPISVSGTVSSTYPPAIACDGDKVYVAWSGTGVGGYSNIYFNRTETGGLGGGFLTVPLLLDAQPPAVLAGQSQNPRVAAAGDEVYVVWDDGRNGLLGTFNRDIYFQRSTNAGLTWLPSDVRIDLGSAPGAAQSGPAQIALGTGVGPTLVYVAYPDVRNGYADIYFNRSDDAGATWLPADVRADDFTAPGGSNSYSLRMASSGSSVGLVWWEELTIGSGNPLFTASMDGGLTFQLRNVRTNTGPGASVDTDFPDIAAAGPTTFHVVWEDLRGPAAGTPQWDIYTNRWDVCVTASSPVAGGPPAPVSLDIPLDGGLPYLGLAALGYLPGIALGPRTFPLNPDSLFFLSLDPAFASIFVGFSGTLSPAGTGSAAIAAPAGSPIGLPFFVAFLTLDPASPFGIRTITRPVPLAIL